MGEALPHGDFLFYPPPLPSPGLGGDDAPGVVEDGHGVNVAGNRPAVEDLLSARLGCC